MKLSTRILLAFALVLILSIIDTLSNYVLSIKVEQNAAFLNKSQEIIRNSGKLHKEIIEMQSSFRGFLLTQDTSFRDDYDNGEKSIPPLFTEQKKLIADNPARIDILDSIQMLHRQWTAYADSLIGAREKVMGGIIGENQYDLLFENKLKKQIGKKLNNLISAKFSEFDKTEYQTRSIHGNNLTKSIRSAHIYSFTFFVLTIIIGIASTVYIVSLISKRIKTMVQLAEGISKGKFTTVADKRRDELSSLSESLNVMSGNLLKNINELKKRNAELDKFAYVVSHDLKAPIRGIHNVIKWIEEDLGNEQSPQMKKYLEIIPQRTKRMENLINGLLDYARIREKTNVEITDVNELVKEITETLVPRNFIVETKNLPVFTTERLKLEQLFSNLISNAVKYTTPENGRIIISCKPFPDYYEFSVKDNGTGIEPQYHEKIFELFQTLREKDEKESTGIGLAIIKKILDEQHCTIHVNSSLGQGAEFIFTWPRLNMTKNEKENNPID